MSTSMAIQTTDHDDLFPASLIDQSIQDSLKAGYQIRPLSRNAFHKGYVENLQTLTWTGDVSHDQFLEHFEWMRTKGVGWFYNVVIEHKGRIVGSGVLIVERKFIWGLGKVGLIIDICITEGHQAQGLGKAVVQALNFIAVREGCLRTQLDCGLDKTAYYMKLGFKTVGIQMVRGVRRREAIG